MKKNKIEHKKAPLEFHDLIDKEHLTIEDLDDLIVGTEELFDECNHLAGIVGGTISSSRVRKVRAHLSLLTNLLVKKKPVGFDYFPLIEKALLAQELARQSLARHNAQPRKFISYNDTTGVPHNKPDYTNVNLRELQDSFEKEQSGVALRRAGRVGRRHKKRKDILH